MSQPTRKEVQAFIDALKYGMKVTHKPEFLIALAEGFLNNAQPTAYEFCEHEWKIVNADGAGYDWHCSNCCSTVRRFDKKQPQ